MDNEFYLPTGAGVPLRVALSGTFTPGVKGGVNIAPDMVRMITPHCDIVELNVTTTDLKFPIPFPFIHRAKWHSCHLLVSSL